MFHFRQITLFCLEKRLSTHKMTLCSKNLGGYGPFVPPGYAYGLKTASYHEKNCHHAERHKPCSYKLPKTHWTTQCKIEDWLFDNTDVPFIVSEEKNAAPPQQKLRLSRSASEKVKKAKTLLFQKNSGIISACRSKQFQHAVAFATWMRVSKGLSARSPEKSENHIAIQD